MTTKPSEREKVKPSEPLMPKLPGTIIYDFHWGYGVITDTTDAGFSVRWDKESPQGRFTSFDWSEFDPDSWAVLNGVYIKPEGGRE